MRQLRSAIICVAVQQQAVWGLQHPCSSTCSVLFSNVALPDTLALYQVHEQLQLGFESQPQHALHWPLLHMLRAQQRPVQCMVVRSRSKIKGADSSGYKDSDSQEALGGCCQVCRHAECLLAVEKMLACSTAISVHQPSHHPACACFHAAVPAPCVQWPGRQWKVAAWIGGILVSGVGVPAFAVWWQQSKLQG